MTDELEPLDPEAMAVLQRLSPGEPVPPAAASRIFAAVEARIAMAPGGGGGDGAGGAKGAPPSPAPSGAASWVARNPWIALTAAMVVGGAMGAGVKGSVSDGTTTKGAVTTPRAPVAVAPPADPVAASSPVPWKEVAPVVSGAPPIPSAPAVTHAHASSALVAPPPPESGQELAAESAVLDLARTAIARGEADHALAAVERHATAFPHGVLREEREALAVKALVLAGRGDDARARAAKFRAKYPESLFLAAIDSALRSLP
jgi:hypothetical protein